MLEAAQPQMFQAEMRFVPGTRSGNEISSGSFVFVGWPDGSISDPTSEATDVCEVKVPVFLTRFFGGGLSSVALRLVFGGIVARSLWNVRGNRTRLVMNAGRRDGDRVRKSM